MRVGKVRVTLHGHLWRYHPERIRTWEEIWPEGKSIASFMRTLGVPAQEVMLYLVNGARKDPDHKPSPGDHVEVLPVIDGG